MKKEAKWQTILNQYLRESKLYGFFELKQTDKDYLLFSKIEKHQIVGLQATELGGLVWKLSDQDTRQKPCDTLSIPPLPSYLVIFFTDTFYMVRIGEIIKLMASGQKSISRENAKLLAEKIIKCQK